MAAGTVAIRQTIQLCVLLMANNGKSGGRSSRKLLNTSRRSRCTPVKDRIRSNVPRLRSTVLKDANDAVRGDRNKDYGHPLDNHQTTADMWSAYLGVPISPEQVCMMNIIQKVSRTKTSFTHDTLTDIAGYADNAEIVINEREDRMIDAA